MLVVRKKGLRVSQKGGSKRMELNSKTRRFHIFEGQILSIQDLKGRMSSGKTKLPNGTNGTFDGA